MTLYTRTDTIKRSWRVSFSCVFAYFHNELRQPSVETLPSCRKYSFPSLEFEKFPQQTRFLPHRLSYLSFPPASPQTSSSPIYFSERVDLGTAFSNISPFSTALFGSRRVRFEATWYMVCHELVIQSQNHTMIILTVKSPGIPRNTCLHLQIHSCNTNLKLSR